ncbi:MAG: DUF424 family protein [archaeon]|nr:DUF424 family protein [archaeon]
MISFKIHKSYRIVAAFCDSDLVGKKFEEGNRQLDLRENFYKEKEVSSEEAINIMIKQAREDATFNIVGKESIEVALEVGIINEKSIGYINKIPFALIFL